MSSGPDDSSSPLAGSVRGRGVSEAIAAWTAFLSVSVALCISCPQLLAFADYVRRILYLVRGGPAAAVSSDRCDCQFVVGWGWAVDSLAVFIGKVQCVIGRTVQPVIGHLFYRCVTLRGYCSMWPVRHVSHSPVVVRWHVLMIAPVF